jgi:hypothetical protein
VGCVGEHYDYWGVSIVQRQRTKADGEWCCVECVVCCEGRMLEQLQWKACLRQEPGQGPMAAGAALQEAGKLPGVSRLRKAGRVAG